MELTALTSPHDLSASPPDQEDAPRADPAGYVVTYTAPQNVKFYRKLTFQKPGFVLW